MQELMIFEGHEVEVLEIKGQVLFNPKHVAECLDIADVKSSIRNFNEKQLVKVKNSDVQSMHFRKLNNAGENFLTESGVYKLVFKSRKPNAEAFTDWIADEVLPTLRKTGSYDMPKQKVKSQAERLASVNNAVKILMPMLEKAGCGNKIQLLTAKQLYEKADVFLPVEIEADKRYWDTVHIARQAGIYYKTSGKPADKAVNEIIRRIGVTEEDYTDTWESKGKWQGAVRKYFDSVIERVKCWIADNDYPADIEYQQVDGQVKAYHVTYQSREVA